jgi:hypothetical protein
MHSPPAPTGLSFLSLAWYKTSGMGSNDAGPSVASTSAIGPDAASEQVSVGRRVLGPKGFRTIAELGITPESDLASYVSDDPNPTSRDLSRK